MNELLKTTQNMLRQSKLSSVDISQGAGVSLDWMREFRQGRYKDPGVNKVQAVHDFLMKQRRK